MYGIRSSDKVQAFEGVICYGGTELGVKAVILPTKHAPHVSADSPRYREPGHRAEVVDYQLFDDTGEDVTDTYFLDTERAAIKRKILSAYTESIYEYVAARIMAEGVVA